MPTKLKETKMEENSHGHLNDVVVNQEAEQPAQNEVEETAQSRDTEQFDSKFAALSRREKALREREAELEQRYGNREKEVPLEYKLKQNPLKALEEMGLSYDKLTELALNDGQLTPDMQMKLMRDELEDDYRSKFEALEKRLNDKEVADEESRYNSVKENFMGEIDYFVKNNKDSYEFVDHNQAKEVVYDVIEEHYNETGRILDIKDAVDAVESYLEEEAEKLFQLNKIKSRFEPNRTPEPEETPRQSQTTLSNAHSAQAQERVARTLSDEESKREIAKLLRWN
jgi:hypothetical protein